MVCLAVLGLSGCVSTRDADDVPPDERFGHRYVEQGPEGRETVDLAVPDTAQAFFTYPAVFDTVHVRPAPFAADEVELLTPVEVLVKGSFPDTCLELSAVEQERAGHILDVRLLMRKPQGAVCAAVRRPYRFYLMLEGLYAPGNYTLKLNGEDHPFEIRAPAADAS